mmetsp:Transcript_36653/g.44839  ORF Transcript_36653/g.44839 Transcript_36653/m.44839 type:complete len:139 (+) Transcript_36653:31-447(+)
MLKSLSLRNLLPIILFVTMQEPVESILVAVSELQSRDSALSELVESGIQLLEGERVRVSFHGQRVPFVAIASEAPCFVIESSQTSQMQSMVDGLSLSLQAITLVLLARISDSCSNPSFLEVRDEDSLFIPIFVEPLQM